MLKAMSIISLLFCSSNSFATKYFKLLHEKFDSNQINSHQIRSLIHKQINEKHNPPQGWNYKKARKELFGNLHLQKDTNGLFVKDVYCNIKFRKNVGIGVNQIPNYKIVNTEHTWPQSKFTKAFSKDLQKNDLHHLYPAQSRANSSRSNLTFGPVDEIKSQACNASKRGFNHKVQRTVFMPPSQHMGNVARALFYFSVRYNINIDQDQEDFLKLWHQLDPVDQEEITRNNNIRNIQGNKNPFIENPDLVATIDDF